MFARALITERDNALRELMLDVLRKAEYDVRECSTALDLELELRSLYLAADCVLFVLNADVAAACLGELSLVASARSSAGLARAQVIYTCEFGALRQPPDLGGCDLAGLFEKPFDLDELGRVARACRAPFVPRWAASLHTKGSGGRG